jgi:hypothetical protein
MLRSRRPWLRGFDRANAINYAATTALGFYDPSGKWNMGARVFGLAQVASSAFILTAPTHPELGGAYKLLKIHEKVLIISKKNRSLQWVGRLSQWGRYSVLFIDSKCSIEWGKK